MTPNTSGSASVQPSFSTDYTGTAIGSGGTATCVDSSGTPAGTLNVTPPPAPTTTIAASSSSIYIGQSTNILATFAAGSGDTLTADNIDSPEGTGLGATTNPDASKTITFTPSSAGTYTFYARAQTSYYTSWTTYASVPVTVSANPSCTVSFAQNPIASAQYTTLAWTSSNATSFSIANLGSETPNQASSTSVSPPQSTDYTGTVSSGGVINTCKASSGTPQGTLNVSCAPLYSCSGNTIVQTNTDCSTTQTTCTAPAYCSSGSTVCLTPPPTFNSSGAFTGHLQVKPSLLRSGGSTKVYWNVSNVSTCRVTPSNGPAWTIAGNSGNNWTSSPGLAEETSAAIMQQTIFTLSCTGLDSSTINETQAVNIAPIFQEL